MCQSDLVSASIAIHISISAFSGFVIFFKHSLSLALASLRRAGVSVLSFGSLGVAAR
jgi:hypothetical protein